MLKHKIEKIIIPNCVSICCHFINCDLTIYNIKSTDNLDENKIYDKYDDSIFIIKVKICLDETKFINSNLEIV